MAKVLCYKSEGRCFDPSWCHWNFSLTKSFRSHYVPGVDSASNRNEYQEHLLEGKSGRCVRLTLSAPCAVVMKLGTIISWKPLGHSRTVTGLLYLFLLTLTLFKNCKILTSNFLCLIKHSHKYIWGYGVILPCIKNFSTRLVISVTLRKLYPR